MEYARLGNTGLEVSRLCLGCMSYGEPDRGSHPWTLTEDQSRPFLRKAIEMGIAFATCSDTVEINSRRCRDLVGPAMSHPEVSHRR